VLEGKNDLLVREDEGFHVLDWKTAPPGQGLQAYARQVGLYATIVQQVHDAPVRASVAYTPDGELVPVDRVDEAEVERLIREARG